MTTRTILIPGATSIGPGGVFPGLGSPPSFQVAVAGTGSVSATVDIEARNQPSGGAWVLLATVTLSGTGSATDGCGSLVQHIEYRADVTALSGTGATVEVAMAS